jgi:ABC-2 type transport system ATP-binding protein
VSAEFSGTAALAVAGVTHRFGSRSALRDCSFAVPVGAVTALVGRNGAGKTTLLRAAAGLLRIDTGTVHVFGAPLGTGLLPRIGYLAQQAPLYRMLTVAQTLRVGGRLNPGWDAAYANRLVEAAMLPPAAKVGSLSAGQRTRLALVMALGKRPELLLLDEPLATLDPVARTEVVGVLMAEVAEHSTTVVMSSHVIADIENICDHVVVLGDGRVRLAGEVDQALSNHRLAVGATGDRALLADADVVEVRPDGAGFTALVRAGAGDGTGAGAGGQGTVGSAGAGSLSWHRPTLEEMLMGYLRPPAPETTTT